MRGKSNTLEFCFDFLLILPIQKAKFEFIASGDDELSVQVGEIIFIDSEAPGWYSGTNSRGQSGLFPANYVELQ